jgi:D-sedoheptulose 7-phosphate isomerase
MNRENRPMAIKSIREHFTRTFREGARLRLRAITSCAPSVVAAAELIASSLHRGGKLLLFGNGGSAADAQHIAAEFVCRFHHDRAPLAAVALTTDTSILTAVGNDYGFRMIFSRQVAALAAPGDVVLAISTSGSSPNIIEGARQARRRGIPVIGLSGGSGGPLAKLSSITIRIPSQNTAHVQECHIAIGHVLCEAAEYLVLPGAAGRLATASTRRRRK